MQNKATKKRSIDEVSSDEEKKTKKTKGEVTRLNAEKWVKKMACDVTGARPGEMLEGCSVCTKGALMRLCGSESFVFPPRKVRVQGIKQFPDLWREYMIKLCSINFFAEMDDDSMREKWLLENGSDSETDLASLDGALVELVQPGSDFMSKVDDPDALDQYVGCEEPVLAADIKNLVPKKSKAKNQTLFFLHGMWRVEQKYAVTYKHCGTCPLLNLVTGSGECDMGHECSQEEVIYKLGEDEKALSVLCNRHGISLDSDSIMQVAKRFIKEDIGLLEECTRGFTMAAFKSLMQKIIRFAPSHVVVRDDENVRVVDMLVFAMAKLLSHTGSFQPQIQKFVTGLESFTKRLVIIAFEDSYVEPSDLGIVCQLMMSAFVTQRCKAWKPSAEMVESWFQFGIKLLSERRCFSFDSAKGEKIARYNMESTETRQHAMKLVSALLDEVNGMKGDLNFIRDIASRSTNEELPAAFSENIEIRGRRMPIERCIDQHWIGDIIYFLPREVVDAYTREKKALASAPFEHLLNAVFKKVTGINPRRTKKSQASSADSYRFEFESDEFVRHVIKAQKLALMCIQNKQSSTRVLELDGQECAISGSIDDGWLSGMLGPVYIKLGKSTEAMVSLRSGETDEFVVVRRPVVRKSNKEGLTEEEETEALAELDTLLKRGIPLSACRPPLKHLEGAVLLKRKPKEAEEEDTDVLKCCIRLKDKRIVSWEEAKKYDIGAPILVPEDTDLGDLMPCVSFQHTYGTASNTEQAISALVSEYPEGVVRKAVTLLGTSLPCISFENISRSGGGTKRSVMVDDIYVYQFLLRASLICPAALKRKQGQIGSFDVVSLPFLWTLRDLVAGSIDAPMVEQTSRWKGCKMDESRTPHPHQLQALKDLIDRKAKGHFLWMTVGAGKTLVVLMYLLHLIERGELPPYVIISLPSSAFEGVENELNALGFKHNRVVPTPKGPVFHRHRVSLVEHDHMRRMEDTLLAIAPECFFVMDECHLGLNDTKRTSMALDVARLSKEFIALTGTPIIDNKVTKLVPWLEQIVPFEVNLKNIWVAAASMISHLYNTGIDIESSVVEAVMNEEEKLAYRKLVPAGMGGTNASGSFDDLRKATDISYKAMSKEIVNQVRVYLEQDLPTFVVARSLAHQEELAGLIQSTLGISGDDILVLNRKKSTGVYLTDKTVESGKMRPYKVVVAMDRHNTGYSVTYLKAMVKGVYPSNQANREQMEGRINRMGQSAKKVPVSTVHCGVLSYIMRNHDKAANASAALREIAKTFNLE